MLLATRGHATQFCLFHWFQLCLVSLIMLLGCIYVGGFVSFGASVLLLLLCVHASDYLVFFLVFSCLDHKKLHMDHFVVFLESFRDSHGTLHLFTITKV